MCIFYFLVWIFVQAMLIKTTLKQDQNKEGRSTSKKIIVILIWVPILFFCFKEHFNFVVFRIFLQVWFISWPTRANFDFKKTKQNLNCKIKQNLGFEINLSLTFKIKHSLDFEKKKNQNFQIKQNLSYEIKQNLDSEIKQNLNYKIKQNLTFEIKQNQIKQINFLVTPATFYWLPLKGKIVHFLNFKTEIGFSHEE